MVLAKVGDEGRHHKNIPKERGKKEKKRGKRVSHMISTQSIFEKVS